MGIFFLVECVFSLLAAFVIVYNPLGEDGRKQSWATKCLVATMFGIVGTFGGGVVSAEFGEAIVKKYLASPITILETVDLNPFPNSNGAYIVVSEKNGKKALYLQGGKLFEKSYNEIADRIVFANTTTPAKQLVKVNVGSFWEWFAFIPKTYRFVIPLNGLQEGNILETYKYIPIPE